MIGKHSGPVDADAAIGGDWAPISPNIARRGWRAANDDDEVSLRGGGRPLIIIWRLGKRAVQASYA